MNWFKLFRRGIVVVLLIGLAFYAYTVWSQPSEKPQLYEVENPVQRDISQIISSTGTLKLKGQVKIGSQVDGIVKELYFQENDQVSRGQLLAEIDTGKGDTEVREAEGSFEKAVAELDYQKANYVRQQQLFKEQLISEENLQEVKKNYLQALADVKALKATYEKKQSEFQNSKVYAPTSGIIIVIGVAKGEKVTSGIDGGIIFWLAPDVTRIEANLIIDEKDIGQIQKGQKVQMVVDTYPNRIFESTIQNISFTPIESEGFSNSSCAYQAMAFIDNPELLLRPGMSVKATIDVASAIMAPTLTSRTFLIKQEHLQQIAEVLNYELKELDKQAKKNYAQEHPHQNIQYVWQVCDNCFVETPVEIGINDDIYFEVKGGLKGDESLVVDVLENDEMQKIYEKLFRKM